MSAGDNLKLVVSNTHPWVHDLTIGEVLKHTAKAFPQRDGLVFPKTNLHMSYAEYDRQVDTVAKSLLALGIHKGDHVALWATNVPQWPLLQMATARIGAVLVNINPAYGLNGLEYALKQCDMKALFLTDTFHDSDYMEMLRRLIPGLDEKEPQQLTSEKFPQLNSIIAIRGGAPRAVWSWEAFIEKAELVADIVLANKAGVVEPDDLVNIQYTSGTTSRPKATMLSHRNILLNAYYVTECQNITEHDRMCIAVPFYHCFGCVMGTLGAVVRGAAMITPAEYFDASATLDAMEKEKATVIYGVPTMFIAMLEEDVSTRDLSRLRSGVMAGSLCPSTLMYEVVNRLGADEITIAYGLTEASPVITQTLYNDTMEHRIQTIGKPLPGVEVKIADLESGKPLAANQAGELCCRGHNVMLGYYKNPEGTAKTIDDGGWLHSGDVAVMREDGYYQITGRIKDIVIYGGENIFPDEIEAFLLHHDAIEEVAVVGVPDKKFGENLCAWIKLHKGKTLTKDALKAFCKGNIADYKIPHYITFVDAFPLTVTGKIQKFKIRQQATKELGLGE
jgi:fatty-acyl-CoA synthase